MGKALGFIGGLVGLAVLGLLIYLFAFLKPYNQPLYEEIGNSETGYLIALDEKGGEKYDSVEALAEQKVATRRVQIPKRWKQTGRLPASGEWIPTARLVKVDRAPVTREWAVEGGTAGKDQAIWIESSDSIGFSVGFSCTARVTETDSDLFLYNYPNSGGSESRLAQVMDDEVRNKIQEVAADFAAGYDLDELREKKQDLIAKVREVVIPYCADKGIEVNTIGMFGGLAYENAEIQTSIDAVFVAQQEKNKESALLAAMDSKKLRLEQEGEAKANEAREEARGKADAIKLVAEAEAESIKLVTAALEEAQQNPVFIEVKRLEVESQRIRQWNGSVPQMIFGEGGNGFVPMIQIPQQAQK